MKQSERASIMRVISDLIEADGIIDTREITFLETLRAKYSIKTEDEILATSMTFADSLNILLKADEKLKNFSGVKIVFVDERLSSVEAEEQLKFTIKDWKQRKKLLDQVSASIILQTYLDSK